MDDLIHTVISSNPRTMSKPFIVSTFSPYESKNFFYHFADTYQEAVELAEWFYLQTGKVVAVHKVAQDPSTIASHAL